MNLKDTMNNNNYTISWLNELSNKKAENPNLLNRIFSYFFFSAVKLTLIILRNQLL